MENVLRRLTHLLLGAIWLSASVLAGFWHPAAGVGVFGVGLLLFVRAIRKGSFNLPASPVVTPETSERDAKMIVTQVLRNLTRVQVAYLCQDFKSREEGRAWLKQALPRSFRPSLDTLYSNLETARMGTPPPGLRLAMQVLARRDELARLEKALEEAHAEHPEHAIAHPVLFVVTELLNAEADSEPEIVLIAGWDTRRPTLLPQVDTVTFYADSEDGGGKLVRGQADFAAALQALGAERVKRLAGGKSTVYVAEAIDDPVAHGVKLDKVPLGFVIGAAELL